MHRFVCRKAQLIKISRMCSRNHCHFFDLFASKDPFFECTPVSLVNIALWNHPTPSRTRKWNAAAPMVVWLCHVRVGHCQGLNMKPRSDRHLSGAFLCPKHKQAQRQTPHKNTAIKGKLASAGQNTDRVAQNKRHQWPVQYSSWAIWKSSLSHPCTGV